MSAFAFQGTNAHALLQAPPDGAEEAAEGRVPLWQQQRIWYAPQPHRMLSSVACGAAATVAAFEVQLLQPALAFLWHHQVRACCNASREGPIGQQSGCVTHIRERRGT